MQRVNMPSMHRKFVTETVATFQGTSDDEWLYAVTHLPKLRDRRVYDDMNDIYAEAYIAEDYHVLTAALTLAILQIVFYDMLRDKRMGLDHVNKWHVEHATYWNWRLGDRLREVSPPSSKKRVYVPPSFPDKVTHTWLQ